ncbi:pyridoxamine 5'-phosphate oxidase-domain-containing protein [Umbelopsis sp. PMI_123]|nr:pyridoxamine 5'-phosphate oxidase-domain-containing protein [Umbelopsis sp. PMI_123]
MRQGQVECSRKFTFLGQHPHAYVHLHVPLPKPLNMSVNYTLLILVINAIVAWSLVIAVPAIMEESPAFAARQARQIVREEGIGTLITMMDHSVQPEFASMPFGIMEYYADIGTGDLLLLMSDLQVNVRNALKYPHVSFSVRVSDKSKHRNGRYPVENPRMTLMGKLDRLPSSEYPNAFDLFTAAHPDARWWAPKNESTGPGFHDFRYYTLKVSGLYVIDGFGGAHYVGWMNETLYHSPHLIQGPLLAEQSV